MSANSNKPESDRATTGKISRLPQAIRQELNQRLGDGQRPRDILLWLNSLEEVRAILISQFEGIPISEMNLSRYRQGDYAKWLARQDRLAHTRELSQYAAKLAQAGGDTIASGAVTIASGQILDLLETIEDAAEKKLEPETLMVIAKSLNDLRKTELQQKTVNLKEKELALANQQFQLDAAAIALKVLRDDRAKSIEAGAATNDEKIQLLGQHLFGNLWKPKA